MTLKVYILAFLIFYSFFHLVLIGLTAFLLCEKENRLGAYGEISGYQLMKLRRFRRSIVIIGIFLEIVLIYIILFSKCLISSSI